MVALILSSVGRKIVLALAFMAALAWMIHIIREDAARDAIQNIERKNRKSIDRADSAERQVLDCRGAWNRKTSRCEL